MSEDGPAGSQKSATFTFSTKTPKKKWKRKIKEIVEEKDEKRRKKSLNEEAAVAT